MTLFIKKIRNEVKRITYFESFDPSFLNTVTARRLSFVNQFEIITSLYYESFFHVIYLITLISLLVATKFGSERTLMAQTVLENWPIYSKSISGIRQQYFWISLALRNLLLFILKEQHKFKWIYRFLAVPFIRLNTPLTFWSN